MADDDEGVWDSMAVMSSEIWNKGEEDELGIISDQELLPDVSNCTFDEACDKFLTSAQYGLLKTLTVLHETFGDSLLSYGDEDGYTALHRASYNGHINIVKYLISKGSSLNAKTLDGWEPLHCACRWNKTTVVSLLIQNGANINSLTNGHQTPLHLAACNDLAINTLQLLLSQDDIDVNIRNGKGETAYELAVTYGRNGHLFEMKEDSVDFKL